MHSMVGMTESGQLINVKLRLPEKHANKPTSPSIVEFARNDFRAKMVCIASDDNGPENPEGVLLLSGCQKEGSDKSKNLEVYTAQWADVIASDSQSPRYFSGLSRMVIQPFSNEVIKLKALLDRAEKAGDSDKAEQLQAKIDDPVNWSYPVILYYPQETETFNPNQVDELIDAGARMVDVVSESGPTGGIAIRALTSDGHVIEESYSELYARYIVTETRIQTGRELMQALVDDWEWISREDVTIEVFPIGKINSGPVANKMYSKEANYSFIERYFYENDKPRVCHGIIRISYNEDAHLTLLSKYFALSKPIGDPARLDSNGGLSKIFDGEDVKLAQYIEDDNAIVPRADTIESMQSYQARAMWLMSDQIDYKNFVNQVEATDPMERLKTPSELPRTETIQDGPELTETWEESKRPESEGVSPQDRVSTESPTPSPAEEVMDEIEISFDEPDPADEVIQESTESPADIEHQTSGSEGSETDNVRKITDYKTVEHSVETELPEPQNAKPESHEEPIRDDHSEPEVKATPEREEAHPSTTPAKPEPKKPSGGVGAFLQRKK